MQYTSKEKLPLIKLQEGEKTVSFARLTKVILERPANTLYFECNGKLCGIVSMGDIRRAVAKQIIKVNECFTYVFADEYMRARNIFHQYKNINEVPVIDENGALLGEYARWDDLLFENIVFPDERIWNWHVALVRPCGLFQKKKKLYQFFYEKLSSKGAVIDEIEPGQIMDYVDDVDWIVLADKGETSAFETIYIYMNHYVVWGRTFRSCGECFNETKKVEMLFEAYVNQIKQQGIYVLNMGCWDNDYYKVLKQKMEDRNVNSLILKNNGKMPEEICKDFFDDIYTKDYAESIEAISSLAAVDVGSVCGKLKDCSSQYYNVKNGERKTLGQPEIYDKSIYLIGPCFMWGSMVEDKNTIASFLQVRLNDLQYKIKVVNCGSLGYLHLNMALARMMDIPLKKGDIVVVACEESKVLHGIPMVNMADVLEKHHVPAEWLTDCAEHSNHKVNELYSKAIFDALEPVMIRNVPGQGEYIKRANDMVKQIYIDQYFLGYHFSEYEKVGSIVMNCNPFTYGHRYLIEQAINKVDFLIIFVVEEDKSVFSFVERLSMVKAGVADLEHIMVVPSGQFILSQTTFPEYFIKAADEDLVKNAEDDIRIFAEKIAPHLNISYRFVGEEPEDMVTREYNEAMKRILPKYGIKLVEIPRKEQKGRYISASAVRKCLEENDREQLKELVPETTIDILFLQNE